MEAEIHNKANQIRNAIDKIIKQLDYIEKAKFGVYEHEYLSSSITQETQAAIKLIAKNDLLAQMAVLDEEYKNL